MDDNTAKEKRREKEKRVHNAIQWWCSLVPENASAFLHDLT